MRRFESWKGAWRFQEFAMLRASNLVMIREKLPKQRDEIAGQSRRWLEMWVKRG